MESFQKHSSKRQVGGGQKYRASRFYEIVHCKIEDSPHSWKDSGLLPLKELKGWDRTTLFIFSVFIFFLI